MTVLRTVVLAAALSAFGGDQPPTRGTNARFRDRVR